MVTVAAVHIGREAGEHTMHEQCRIKVGGRRFWVARSHKGSLPNPPLQCLCSAPG